MILVTKGDTVLFFALLQTIIGFSKPTGRIYLYPVPVGYVLYGCGGYDNDYVPSRLICSVALYSIFISAIEVNFVAFGLSDLPLYDRECRL